MKKIIIGIAVVGVIISLYIVLSSPTPKTTYFGVKDNTPTTDTPSSNVSIENGKQIIVITAKAGYEPRATIAKADLPTILRVKTDNTFDCSSSLRIPSLNYFKNLPPSGATDIELPTESAGATLKALCSMGMYSFSVNFVN
jgi:plastocyanin domain-containing protein